MPKRELVRGLVTAFEGGRLKIAKGLPLGGAFMDELRAFRVTLTAKGHDVYAARSGEHDDLVVAVALAVWDGVAMSAIPPGPDIHLGLGGCP